MNIKRRRNAIRNEFHAEERERRIFFPDDKQDRRPIENTVYTAARVRVCVCFFSLFFVCVYTRDVRTYVCLARDSS